MSRWTNSPPEHATVSTLPLRRTPAAGVLEAIVTSTDLVGRETHYYQGRTLPCTGPDCPACEEGISSRWHAWLSAVNTRTKEHFILELTAAPAKVLAQYKLDHGTLRGALLRVHRYNQRANGRIHLAIKPVDLTTTKLPTPPHMTVVLLKIWGATNVDPAIAAEAAVRIPDEIAGRIGGNNRDD